MSISSTLHEALIPSEIVPFPARRLYLCRCGQPIFFRNSLCATCQAPLGYDPAKGMLYPLRPSSDGLWQADVAEAEPGRGFLRCRNFESPAGCNWLIDVRDESPAEYCIACRLNRTIPDLSKPGNPEKWRRIETAKRRLVSSLLRLNLPVVPKLNGDADTGLAFDFLRGIAGESTVVTGHADGVITINADEAEDVKRERIRVKMHEPYRTLLGHLRHEVGHYYWERLIPGTSRLKAFRALFGDERQDYAAALNNHYQNGPPDWQAQFVSAYASSHPWEDWAETWAHYLHMIDTLDTASSFNLQLRQPAILKEAFDSQILSEPESEEPSFLPLLNGWVQLTAALNEMSLSMGLADFYPFVLSPAAATKLHFVHLAVHRKAESMAPPANDPSQSRDSKPSPRP